MPYLKKIYLLIAILFQNLVCTEIYGQVNYFNYHAKIIAAEDSLIKGANESAFKIYAETFNQYDFVFPRDPLIAAQFAYYYGEKELAVKFLIKGFQWGLMPFHILRCPVFNIQDRSFTNLVKDAYFKERPMHLKKINVEVAEKVLNMRWLDQIYKNINPPFTIDKNGKVKLDTIMSQILDTVKSLTNKYGFPGQKLTGILHNNTMKELGKNGELDLPNRYKNLKDKEFHKAQESNSNLNTFDFLSNEAVLIALYHLPCAFHQIGEKILIDNIKAGHLYPADFAFLYTAEYCKCFSSFKRKDSIKIIELCPNTEPFNGGYGVAIKYDINDSIRINENRQTIGMCTLSHNNEFNILAQKKNIIVRFGFMEYK
jgi:hypothetical protein